MGKTDYGVRGFQIREDFFGFIELAQVTAQEGVDEAGLGAEAEAFGDFHGFMDGGVSGDFIQPENLVKAEAQQVLQGGLLLAAIGFALDEPVEGGLPADGAIDDFLAQAAVGGGQGGISQLAIQEGLGEHAGGAFSENLRRDLSWILAVHQF